MNWKKVSKIDESKWEKPALQTKGNFPTDAQYVVVLYLNSPQNPSYTLLFQKWKRTVEFCNQLDLSSVFAAQLFLLAAKKPDGGEYFCVLTTKRNVNSSTDLEAERPAKASADWPLWKSYALAGGIVLLLLAITYFARFVKGGGV